MPFTPFHFGPAALVTSLRVKHFSFWVFVLSQFVMDLEPYYFLMKGEPVVHRLFHTYVGCNIPLVITVVLVMLLFHMRFVPAAVSAAVGVYSHVFFDSLMHQDMKPLYPFSDLNPTLEMIEVGLLHWFCVFCALLAGVIFVFRVFSRRKK